MSGQTWRFDLLLISWHETMSWHDALGYLRVVDLKQKRLLARVGVSLLGHSEKWSLWLYILVGSIIYRHWHVDVDVTELRMIRFQGCLLCLLNSESLNTLCVTDNFLCNFRYSQRKFRKFSTLKEFFHQNLVFPYLSDMMFVELIETGFHSNTNTSLRFARKRISQKINFT